jgi:hypothetical protein
MMAASQWHVLYRRINLGALCGLLILAALLCCADVSEQDPNTVVLWGHTLPRMCLVSWLTGRPCPGCGTTRSLVLLFAGHWRLARAMHPAAIWLGAWIVLQIALRLLLSIGLWRSRQRPTWPFSKALRESNGNPLGIPPLEEARLRKIAIGDAIASGATLLAVQIAPVVFSAI